MCVSVCELVRVIAFLNMCIQSCGCISVCAVDRVSAAAVCSCVCPRLPHPRSYPEAWDATLGALSCGVASDGLSGAGVACPLPAASASPPPLVGRLQSGTRGARVTGRRPRRVSEPRHRQSYLGPREPPSGRRSPRTGLSGSHLLPCRPLRPLWAELPGCPRPLPPLTLRSAGQCGPRPSRTALALTPERQRGPLRLPPSLSSPKPYPCPAATLPPPPL